METLLLLTYGAFCFAAFRLFRIPVNGYTVVTAVVGGVVLIGLIILVMNFNHPYTVVARTYFVSTPIVPAVRGRVVDVPVEANTPLHEGDVLFRLDPEPFALAVAELEARRAQIAAETSQDIDRVVAAESAVDQARSALRLAEIDYERTRSLVEAGAQAPARLDRDRNRLEAARGDLRRTEADLRGAREEQAVVAGTDLNAKLAEAQAQLEKARWELAQTTVRAPADGYVTQVALRPGFYAVPLPLRPSMVFISERPHEVVASFRQIAARRLAVGNEAEIAFHAIPGTVFPGRITKVIDVMSSGEFSASGTLVAPEDRSPPGRMNVVIELEETNETKDLPGGAAGRAAVYSEHWEAFAIIRRILLRMNAWTFYASMDH